MRNDIERVFFTAEEIEEKVAALGEQISKDFEGKNPLFVGVLKGFFVLSQSSNHFCPFLQNVANRFPYVWNSSRKSVMFPLRPTGPKWMNGVPNDPPPE